MKGLLWDIVTLVALAGATLAYIDGTKGTPEKVKPDADPTDLEGIYSVSGVMKGKSYEGLLAIRKRGSLYATKYLLPESATGLGFQPTPDQFVMSWMMPGPDGNGIAMGVNHYKVTPGKTPRMEGKWVGGKSGPNTEVLTFLRAMPKEED